MPLGISERKIERAYGPMDLSGVYKPILATAQKIYADEERRVLESQKQLATTSAELNKLRAGVREADLPDITKMYNQWAAIERQLANNPNLIRKNPDLYGELKSQSNTLYGNMLGTINESKQQSKFEVDAIKTISNPNNINKFRQNALTDYQSKVLRTPISVLKTSRDNDLTSYFNPMIDGSKFYNALAQRVESTLRNIELPGTEKDKFGQVSMIKLEKMPQQGVLIETIYDTLKGNSEGKTELFAEQQLDMMKPEEKKAIIDRYNKFYQKDANGIGEFSRYQLPEQKIIDFSAPKINKTQEFVELMAAKEFISRLPVIQQGKPEFTSKAEEILFRERNRKVSSGEKDDKEQGVFLYDDAVNKIIKSQQQFPGRNYFLNTFEPMLQEIAVEKARFAYPGWNLRAEELSLNYDPARKTIDVYTNRTIKGTAKQGETPDEIPVRKKVASLGRIDLDTEASSEYGVGARRAVLKKQPKEEPVKRTTRSSGRKNIEGF